MLLGPISQEALYDEVARCTVFCLPSLAESAPLVISQAMAAGKPVVASRVGGIPHMIADRDTGRLCRPDDVEDLAGCLDDLLRDSDAARKMGQRAKQQAFSRHAFSSVAAKTIGLYRDVLSARPERVS